jgi:hypothetical protein
MPIPRFADLPPAVERILARDDLLTLARDAETATGIVNKRDARIHDFADEAALFVEALQRHRETADGTNSPAIRMNALTQAGVIARFCDYVGIPLRGADGAHPAGFHAVVLRELDGAREVRAGEEINADMYTAIGCGYRAIRDLRLSRSYRTAVERADLPEIEFVGSGDEPCRADYQFELGAALLSCGKAAQVRPRLIGSEREYWTLTRAGRFARRHRFDYVLALAAWTEGDRGEAARRLTRSRRHLHRFGKHEEQYDVDDLVVALAQADFLATGERSAAAINEAADHLGDALRILERLRDRWKVVSRSRSPLSVAIRCVFADIARAAAQFRGRQAAELGLRAVLSAKQSGFASRMRRDRSAVGDDASLLGRDVRNQIERIVAIESGVGMVEFTENTEEETQRRLDTLRRELRQLVSPMLADTVLPVPANVARLIDTVGDRYALDYVGLPDLLTWDTIWFRTMIEPTGAMLFESLEIGPDLASFIAELARPDVHLSTILARGPDWHAVGKNLLPAVLRDRLAAVAEHEPIDLIICAHSALSLLPWAALKIDGDARLIQRAVISQTPVLTCLTGERPPSVGGRALVHLVSTAEPGVDGVQVGHERRAWKIRDEHGRVPLSACTVGPDPSPVDVPGSFAAALADPAADWRFAHIASHGSGSGLDQRLNLPGKAISAGRALTLPWPEAVLMASCDVGRLFNVADAEPLNFVMALLAGGSHCVVAGIDTVLDDQTGRIAASIVDQVKNDEVRLEVALRNAQLARVRHPAAAWALIGAYVR